MASSPPSPERTFRYRTGRLEDQGRKPFLAHESTVGLQGGFGHFAPGRALSSCGRRNGVRPWANFNRISSPAWYQWHLPHAYRPLQQQRHRRVWAHGQWHLYDLPRGPASPCI